MAKEAFALYAMGKTLSQADRTHFFNIDIFIQNPIHPSFLETAQSTPPTVIHPFTIQRGRFYEDMGKLLEGMSFDVTVTVTRFNHLRCFTNLSLGRDVKVAEEWAERRLEEHVEFLGYNHEWIKGQKEELTAIITLATQNEVLICQQLYMPWIPPDLEGLVQWRSIRKCGPSSRMRIVKKDQLNLILRGFEQLTVKILNLFGKRTKRNLPKVLRDLDFHQVVKMMIAPENELRRDMSEYVRWDKPVFSKEEVISCINWTSSPVLWISD